MLASFEKGARGKYNLLIFYFNCYFLKDKVCKHELIFSG